MGSGNMEVQFSTHLPIISMKQCGSSNSILTMSVLGLCDMVDDHGPPVASQNRLDTLLVLQHSSSGAAQGGDTPIDALVTAATGV